MFLMKLEMVSEYSKYPREALLKVSSRSNNRKLVKTTPIISLFLESWRTWSILTPDVAGVGVGGSSIVYP